jgi:hypothetical protein
MAAGTVGYTGESCKACSFRRQLKRGEGARRASANRGMRRHPGRVAVAAVLLLAAPLLAVTTDPASPIEVGTPTEVHCQNEPSADVVIFYFAADPSHRFGSELSCPTVGFRQLSPLDGYFVEIDKTQLAGREDALALGDLRNDPGYVSETHVQWLAPTPAPSPTASAP